MADVDTNTNQIPYLTGNDTFLDWVNHYNNYAVEKLNNLELYTGFSGDGVEVVVGTTGDMRCNLSSNITKGITFSGDIVISGALTYDWDAALLGAVKQRIFPLGGYTAIGGSAGWTGTSLHGVTVGQAVRIGMSGGDTDWALARADNAYSAEVVGVVSGFTLGSAPPYTVSNTYVEVTTHGIVQGDFTEANTDWSSGLSAGCIYFLSPGVTGGLTTIEPTIAGHVVKPVLLGVTADKGLVLNYRGQYLSSGGTGGTGGVDYNRFYANLGTVAGSGLLRGMIIGRAGTDNNGWKQVFGNQVQQYPHIVGIAETDEFLLGSNYYIQIATTGWIDNFPNIDSLGVPHLGKVYLGPDGYVTKVGTGTNPQVGIVWNDGVGGAEGVWLAGTIPEGSTENAQSHSFVAEGITYGTAINENLLINGGFDIWQRTLGGGGGATGPGMEGSTGSTHFADRWVRVNGLSGATAHGWSIQRRSFDLNQTDVFGEPKYYARLKNIVGNLPGNTSDDYVHIENRIEDVRTCRGETVNLSFWAKCGITGSTMGIAVTQYDGTTASSTYPAEVALGTLWGKHNVAFAVPNITTTPTGKHYLGMGFRTERMGNQYYDIAKVKLERGNVATINAKVNESEELDKCKRYYQRTYTLDERTHSVTMLDINTPSISVVDFTITPNKDLYYKFPVPMRDVPTITFFSPESGYTGDAYNRSASKDLRNTSGTYGYNQEARVYRPGSPAIGADYSDKNGMYVSIPHGSVLFDDISFHCVLDADLTENMPRPPT